MLEDLEMVLKNITQQSLLSGKEFNIVENDVKNWGTFKDSLRAPVHRWFTYPAGFSYKAVYHSFEKHDIKKGMVVYDPFMGSGTTNVSAKTRGINSVGIEAHPFVYKITKAKMNWDLDKKEIFEFIEHVQRYFLRRLDVIRSTSDFVLEEKFPELVLKCYSKETLIDLFVLKSLFLEYEFKEKSRSFFFVVITRLLREISSAATGWPYIAPKKLKLSSEGKNALDEFVKLSYEMLEDLRKIQMLARPGYKESKHEIVKADSKDVRKIIQSNSVDHIFTSPPYLNNFDYSDRTRLEMYFWGDAKTWGDISEMVRTRLMTSATTQISRNDPKYVVREDFKNTCPEITTFIQNASDELSDIRLTKGGRKSYDLMVIGYFNDMFQVLSESFRVLKKDTKALFVLGDSAPYGVHIPTDKLIGEIGVCLGFSKFEIDVLRKRGGKWKTNPQRHNVPLRESIVTLEK